MNRFPRLFLILLLLLSEFAVAQTARDTTVEVSATVQELPPQVALSWLPTSFPISVQKVFRKLKDGPVWNDIATLAAGATSYVDTDVSVGVSYEYFVVRIFTATHPGSAAGYVNAGIRLPEVTARGKILLIVDSSVAGSLVAELQTFTRDLVGDGWMVIRQDVPRNGTASATKGVIQSLYSLDPANTRSVILFGHVPVPYSGNIAPDGHPDHRGAWPADSYYADMDGTWTDSAVNETTASRSENWNSPGDGRFDPSVLPGDVELEVGRIDLANMPSASPTPGEVDLLRQYLNRVHAYRFGTGPFAAIPRRALIADNFGYFGGEAFSASGWRNFTSFFGSAVGAITETSLLTENPADNYLCAYACGPGVYTGASGVAGTYDFATKRCRSVFNMLFGSYFGDWDVSDSFLRAPLAGGADSIGLVSVWAGRPHWHCYPMALGQTIGHAARLTQNNTGFPSGGYSMNLAGHGIHIGLMGDPSLRLHTVQPASNFVIDSGSGIPALTWTASPEAGLIGYTVLRATSEEGPFVKIGGTIVGTSFTDHTGSPGQLYHYQVRALKLETSASGTYLNHSQGIFGTGSVSSPVSREIQLSGNGRPIVSGAAEGSVENGTAFGTAEVGVQSVTRSFVIANDGTSALALTGTPVIQVSGPAAGDFLVVAQPSPSIASASSSTFQLQFSPTALGQRTATVLIASDDADEGSYTFVVTGSGVPPSPEIAVTPSVIAASAMPNTSEAVPLTIANSGPGLLQWTVGSTQTEYQARDSESFGGRPYDWIEIGPTGNEVTGFSNPDDALSAAIPIGFSFPFFGGNFSSLRVCTNGFVSFGDAVPLFYGPKLPSIEASGDVVAAYWTDLIMDANSHIYTQAIGDLFVVQFQNVARFGAESERVTCQIVLSQSGEIFLQYKTLPPDFTDYSAGIQDGQRSRGLSIAYQSNTLQPQTAVRILPPNFESWLATSQPSGTVAGGASQNFDVLLSSVGMSAGQYFSELKVSSNDADEKITTLPVEWDVSGVEVEVSGNGLGISSGRVMVQRVDGTDFGELAINSGMVQRSFIVRNLGDQPLNVGTVGVSGGGFAVSQQPTAVVPGRGTTTFAISFAPTIAGVVNGTVSFTTTDGDEAAYTFAVKGIALTPLEGWRLLNFGSSANAGLGADSANGDFDGLNNLAEYGFTQDPRNAAGAVPVVVRKNGAGYLEIEFSRNTERTDLDYLVQASDDLTTWTTIASSLNGGVTTTVGARSVQETPTGVIRNVVVEDSELVSAKVKRFLRVKLLLD